LEVAQLKEKSMRYYDYLETPHGRMLLVANRESLVGAYFVGQKYCPTPDAAWKREPRMLRRAKRELTEYFAGKRKRFGIPLAPEGTPFQRAVWREIGKLPCGETITYADLARRAGRPGAARAAGAATGRNPVCVIVPCHRIVGSNGSLTGYAGGLPRKKALLALECGARSAATSPGSRPRRRAAAGAASLR
jgi:methylated-DNA-[protein]-cysteine S-methyltransferase